jgi:hypothetical protein
LGQPSCTDKGHVQGLYVGFAGGFFISGDFMNFQILNTRRGWIDVIKIFDDGERIILRKTFDDSCVDQINCSKAFFEKELELGRIRPA